MECACQATVRWSVARRSAAQTATRACRAGVSRSVTRILQTSTSVLSVTMTCSSSVSLPRLLTTMSDSALGLGR